MENFNLTDIIERISQNKYREEELVKADDYPFLSLIDFFLEKKEEGIESNEDLYYAILNLAVNVKKEMDIKELEIDELIMLDNGELEKKPIDESHFLSTAATCHSFQQKVQMVKFLLQYYNIDETELMK